MRDLRFFVVLCGNPEFRRVPGNAFRRITENIVLNNSRDAESFYAA